MIRGINQQNIFEDDEDCIMMLQIINEVKAVSEFKLFAYCLMGNHCHFLLKEESEHLEQIIKRIGARYVYWFNVKYKRVGHLFQDRYKSEAIENDKYLLSVLRYIHQNPMHAGLCTGISEYEWSSYKEYTGKQHIVDTEFIFSLLDKKGFEEFNKSMSADKYMDCEKTTFRISDADAKKIIAEISKCENAAEFQQMDSSAQRKLLKSFKEAGMSIRQINRLTGVSKGIIERS